MAALFCCVLGNGVEGPLHCLKLAWGFVDPRTEVLVLQPSKDHLQMYLWQIHATSCCWLFFSWLLLLWTSLVTQELLHATAPVWCVQQLLVQRDCALCFGLQLFLCCCFQWELHHRLKLVERSLCRFIYCTCGKILLVWVGRNFSSWEQKIKGALVCPTTKLLCKGSFRDLFPIEPHVKYSEK